MAQLYQLSSPLFTKLSGNHNIVERNVILHITASTGGNIQNWINFVHGRDNGRAPYSVVGDFAQKQIRQLLNNLDDPVAGLRNNLGNWPDTNRHGAIQVSINASAEQIRDWVNGPRRAEFARWIAIDLLGPIHRQWPVVNFRNQLGHFYGHEVTSGRGSEALRASVSKWTNFKWGFGAHQLVPRQDPTNHWDPCMPQDFIDEVVNLIEGATMADIDKLWVENHRLYESGQPGYNDPSVQDALARLNESAARLNAGRGRGAIIGENETIRSVVTDVVNPLPNATEVRTIVAEELAKLPPPSSGGVTAQQVRDIVREELDKTRLGT